MYDSRPHLNRVVGWGGGEQTERQETLHAW